MAVKIMMKNYHLVNKKSGDKMVVYPPRQPGLNQDRKKPKRSDGRWIRVFRIVDANGVDTSVFPRPDGVEEDQVALYHLPGNPASVEVNGETWAIQPIPGVVAPKPRNKNRSVKAATPVDPEDTESQEGVEETAKA